MPKVSLPEIQLSPAPKGEPFFRAEGHIFAQDSVLRAVKAIVERVDPWVAADDMVPNITTGRPAHEFTYRNTSDSGPYAIRARRAIGGRETTIHMAYPSNRPLLFIGMAAIGRHIPLQVLRADVIAGTEQTLSEDVYLGGGGALEGVRPEPEDIAETLRENYTERTLLNLPRTPGSRDRTLEVRRYGAELPELAAHMALAYSLLLQISGLGEHSLEETKGRVAGMFVANKFDDIQAAWVEGENRPRLVTGALTVVERMMDPHVAHFQPYREEDL